MEGGSILLVCVFVCLQYQYGTAYLNKHDLNITNLSFERMR